MDIAKLNEWLAAAVSIDTAWLVLGFAAQAMFVMRFVLQWMASERIKRSIVPETFWYFSFAGGLMLLVYAIHRTDPVIALGQVTGLFIYARNIYLVWLQKRPESAAVELTAAG